MSRPYEQYAYLESVCRALDERPVKTVLGGKTSAPWRIASGLTDAEVEQAETRFDLRFPPDLRALLQHGLPTGVGWPNWRDPDAQEEIAALVDAPYRAMRFDVTHNDVWFRAWGARPEDEAERLPIAFDALAAAPRLVPIYSHRYIPCDPLEAGNPVFSMSQIIDTIYYGNDLADYLAREFGVPRPAWATDVAQLRTIAFWSAITASGGTSLA